MIVILTWLPGCPRAMSEPTSANLPPLISNIRRLPWEIIAMPAPQAAALLEAVPLRFPVRESNACYSGDRIQEQIIFYQILLKVESISFVINFKGCFGKGEFVNDFTILEMEDIHPFSYLLLVFKPGFH